MMRSATMRLGGRAWAHSPRPQHGVEQVRTIFKRAYEFAKRVTPSISATEAAALESGTVGFDRDLFSGNSSLESLRKYDARLTDAEKKFLENEVETLCKMLDDHPISTNQDLPEHVWTYIRENGFLGMIIDKEWGGLQFSPHAHSKVVTKIATRNGATAVSVMVPNSLGPGELLKQYGTEEQKRFFLPKLASGESIPCFALTAPSSGSDAASMRDRGVVCKKDGVLGVKATFKKRYITLAPVASVVGLAFDLQDPQNLLKGVGSEGITLALLEKDTPGLRIGDRHDPVGSAFMNGTVEGDDVFIPMSQVIGGQEMAGKGWRMLMECLAEGRGVSLPALSVAAGRLTSTTVGAYARIRKQFKVPLAELEGVQEHLARMGSQTFLMAASQDLMNSMLNQHEKPAVLSAVMKQQLTSRMRDVINDGMDVLGGAGICRGPSNFMANSYCAVPIAITVEGANTLTRSLIIFGQGLMRSHPHLLNIVRSIQAGNDLPGFKKEVMGLLGHAMSNAAGSLTSALTRSKSKSNVVHHYESQLNKLAKNFAIASDVALVLGGSIKFKELLSGRYADVFANLYIGYSALWYYERSNVEGLDKLLDYSMSTVLYDAQEALHGIYENFPIRSLAFFMHRVSFPFGRTYKSPSDKATKQVADLLSTDCAVRDFLARDMYIHDDSSDRVAMIHHALPKAIEADKILKACRKEKRSPTANEQKIIDEAERLREEIIQVDSFPRLGAEKYESEDYVRPAFKPLGHVEEDYKVGGM